MADAQAVNRTEIRPSPDDRCPECGELVGEEWESFRRDPADPQKLVRHFGGIVYAGPIEPKPARPKRTTREFEYPKDLDVFFHSWCAPRVKLPEKMQEEIAKLFAKAFHAHYENTLARWAKVRQPTIGESKPPRCQAYVASAEGRRVFTMARAEWERLRAEEGKLVEINLERVPTGGVAESA